MIIDCLRVRRHIQDRLDQGDRSLSDRDAFHLESCPRCSALLRSYSRFSRALRGQADAAVGRLDSPSWERIFAGAAAAAAAELPAEARGEGHPTAVKPRVARRSGRLLPEWAATTAARAALLAIVVLLGALFGYREYRIAAARSFVRSSTTEFVSGIFSSSIFSASSEPEVLPGSIEADAGWFDATGFSTQYPASPPAAGSGAQSPP